MQNTLQNSSKYCDKKLIIHFQKKCGHPFVQQVVINKYAKLKVDRFSSLSTGARQVFTTQKPFLSEIPLTMRTGKSNKFSTRFLIKLPCQISLEIYICNNVVLEIFFDHKF